METGHRYKVSPERLEKPGIEPTTTHLQGEWLIHCATEASKINVVQSSIRDRVAAKSDLKYFMRRCKYNQLITVDGINARPYIADVAINQLISHLSVPCL